MWRPTELLGHDRDPAIRCHILLPWRTDHDLGQKAGRVPRNPKGEFLDSPARLSLSILFCGWTAASSGTAPWVRVAATVTLVGWLVLLARHFLRRDRDGRLSEPDESAS